MPAPVYAAFPGSSWPISARGAPPASPIYPPYVCKVLAMTFSQAVIPGIASTLIDGSRMNRVPWGMSGVDANASDFTAG